MSEIKGQLLGIILVLVVFGGISVAMASVFKATGKQIEGKSKNLGLEASEVFEEETTGPRVLSYYED